MPPPGPVESPPPGPESWICLVNKAEQRVTVTVLRQHDEVWDGLAGLFVRPLVPQAHDRPRFSVGPAETPPDVLPCAPVRLVLAVTVNQASLPVLPRKAERPGVRHRLGPRIVRGGWPLERLQPPLHQSQRRALSRTYNSQSATSAADQPRARSQVCRCRSAKPPSPLLPKAR
jgi:hypothetical protein